MVHRKNNRNSFSMFQHYSSRENKKLQHELEKNGRTIEQSSNPISLGKGAQDYPNPKSHHMNRKIFAIIIPCALVVIALVVIGAFSSYHRDAPSTTTPEVATQAKTQKKPKHKKVIKKVHKIKKHVQHNNQPKDNVVTIFQNKASSPKANTKSHQSLNKKIQPEHRQSASKVTTHQNTSTKSNTSTSSNHITTSNKSNVNNKSHSALTNRAINSKSSNTSNK